ncbi:MAG: elongation factor Ts [Deltaproteobacteria bacterium]|nr:elongation factor Ts [Deltaproteobacteria bacterium]
MANITAADVAALRSQTGAGMMDCKKALGEAGGDMEKAVDILRKKGLSAAAKKSGRVAADGAVSALERGSRAILLEVNSETDFVAKTENFQSFCKGVAEAAIEAAPADLAALNAAAFPATGKSVAEETTNAVAKIGENIQVRRFVLFDNPQGFIASYIHAGGKIGVLVDLTASAPDNARVQELGHQVAMHVAAANPQYLRREEVPAAVIAKEKEIMTEKAKASGKPEKILEKIVEGQIGKFFGEICLIEQQFVIDPDQKVGQVVANLGKELGVEITLNRFARFQLGEGIEKRSDDFAKEVADLTK